jgi:lysophospholipase L1-like esterase
VSRSPQPEPYLRGCAFPAAPGVPYPRAAMDALGERLPADTLATARLPVGVRFEWIGDARAVVVDYETATDDLGYRGDGAGRSFSLFRGSERVDEQPAGLGRHRVELSAGQGDERAILYLPEGMRPHVHSLAAIDGAIEPAPPQPRWLCYGDSIAEGWIASGPAAAWPAIAGREQGLDTVNLGYAGSARGEVVSAEQIAALDAEVISIAHGTNCWTRTPHSVELFRAGLDAFLSVVREGHPGVPIVAISPIRRPDAEGVPNRLGATLGALREVFEATVEQHIAHGDGLELVRGAPLVRDDQLPDGIHPGDEGHRALASALGAIVSRACGRS